MLSDIREIPRRVFLDTCVINCWLDHGEQIHDGVDKKDAKTERLREDVEAMRRIMQIGSRGAWQIAVSPLSYREVMATRNRDRRCQLVRLFEDVWAYWRQHIDANDDLPTFQQAEEIRLRYLVGGDLNLLPDAGDRALLCDALVYQCDAFCTRDWTTILRHRDALKNLPLRIVSPVEWWRLIKPWADIYF